MCSFIRGMTMMKIEKSILMMALTLILLPQSLFAKSVRIAVVIDESIEGNTPSVPMAQGEVEKGLIEKGYKLLDAKQVAAARKDASIELMLKGQVPQSLAAMDADLLVVGKIDTTLMGNVLDANLSYVYESWLKVSIIRVSTGEILKTFSMDVRNDEVSKKLAARKSLRKAGQKILDKLLVELPVLDARGAKIEFIVRGVPGSSKLAELADDIKAMDEVTDTSISNLSKRLSRLEITSSSDALTLASRLERSRVPVEVIAASSGRILARWAPGHALGFSLLLTVPAGRAHKRLRWLHKALARVVMAELENISYIQAEFSEEAKLRSKPRPVDIRRLAESQQSPTLVAVPMITRAGKAILLSLAVYNGKTGRRLCAASSSGKPSEISTMVHKLVSKLDKKLLKIAARRKLFSTRRSGAVLLQAKAALMARDKRTLPVHIESVNLDDVFPARLGYYSANPMGLVRIRTSKDYSLDELKVSVFVPGFMNLPWEKVLPKPAVGELIDVPVSVTLDSEKVFHVDENTPVQAEVKVSYRTKDGVGKTKRIVPLMLFDRNALNWKEPRSVAAFVTSKDESIKSFARKAISMDAPGTLPAAMAKPAELFEAMRVVGLRYLKDPVNSFGSSILDYVQYPRETLTYRTGDCDDLAVLYSALLESVGVDTALVTTPGHILVAFKVDPSLSPINELTFDPSMYLVMDSDNKSVPSRLRGTAFRVDATKDQLVLIDKPVGREYWIPVETTSLKSSFVKAWKNGAKELSRWKTRPSSVSIIPVQLAWRSFPAVSLPSQGSYIALDTGALGKSIAAVARQIEKEKKRGLDSRMAELKKRMSRGRRDISAWSESAMLLSNSGKVKEAKKLLEKAKKLAPRDSALLNNMGNVLLLAGDYTQALDSYERTIKEDESLAGCVYANLAVAYVALGDDQKARQAMAESLRYGGAEMFARMGVLPESGEYTAAKKDEAKKELNQARMRQMILQVMQEAKDQQKKTTQGVSNEDLFSNPFPSGGRRGADQEQQRLLSDLLRWVI